VHQSSSAGRGRGSDSDQWSHDKHGSSSSSSSGPRKQLESGSKILISNLNWEVTQDNLKELFSECGEVRRASIAFDRTGRSEGHGEVSFASRGAAEIAVKEFNGALLDGLALKIIVAGGHSSSTSSLSSPSSRNSSSSSNRNSSSSSSRNNSSSSSSSSAPAKFDGLCNNCSKKGHKKSECRQPGGGAHKDGFVFCFVLFFICLFVCFFKRLRQVNFDGILFRVSSLFVPPLSRLCFLLFAVSWRLQCFRQTGR
jgi:THO complex subunit 4